MKSLSEVTRQSKLTQFDNKTVGANAMVQNHTFGKIQPEYFVTAVGIAMYILGYFRKWFVILAIFLNAMFVSKSVYADESVDEVYGAFEFSCVEQIRTQENFPIIMENLGGQKLSIEHANRILMPQKGIAWLFRKPSNYVIGLTSEGVCTVSAPYVNGEKFIEKFEKYTRYKKLSEDRRGSQLEYAYSISHDDQMKNGDAHALVYIVTTPLFKGEGLIVSLLPREVLLRKGMSEPVWPK